MFKPSKQVQDRFLEPTVFIALDDFLVPTVIKSTKLLKIIHIVFVIAWEQTLGEPSWSALSFDFLIVC